MVLDYVHVSTQRALVRLYVRSSGRYVGTVKVSNLTNGVEFFSPVKDKDGREFLLVVLKHTLRDPFTEPTTELSSDEDGDVENDIRPPAREVDLCDTFNGDDPAASSIRKPSQLFLYKPGTDVILLGHAHPPRARESTYVDVHLRMGPIDKTVRAHGMRTWSTGTFGGVAPGPALPLREPLPLIYEHAYGGQDLSDAERPLGEIRNLVGTGVTRTSKSLVGRPANRLEFVKGDKTAPAAFNPIHRHWQPRAQFAGTYDEDWQNNRMPLLPIDFDDRFHICVPPDQWASTPLRGDEPCEILNATPDGEWRFQLPRIAPGFSSIIAGRRADHRTHLDTILIDADERLVELTWRVAIPMPRKLEMIERVVILTKQVL